MNWETIGDDGLFEKRTLPVIVNEQNVGYCGYLKQLQKVDFLPEVEVHFFDVGMKETGMLSIIDDANAIFRLKSGDSMNVSPAFEGAASQITRILAEKSGITFLGILSSLSLLNSGAETTYLEATIASLNSGLVAASSIDIPKLSADTFVEASVFSKKEVPLQP